MHDSAQADAVIGQAISLRRPGDVKGIALLTLAVPNGFQVDLWHHVASNPFKIERVTCLVDAVKIAIAAAQGRRASSN